MIRTIAIGSELQRAHFMAPLYYSSPFFFVTVFGNYDHFIHHFNIFFLFLGLEPLVLCLVVFLNHIALLFLFW